MELPKLTKEQIIFTAMGYAMAVTVMMVFDMTHKPAKPAIQFIPTPCRNCVDKAKREGSSGSPVID